MEWLERNPIQNVTDKEFLTNEVFRLRDLLIRAQQHQQEHENSGVLGGGGGRNWRGNVPYLRVIMCLTQDNVKRLFLARANARSRQELDARNSQIRPPTVFEVISDLWNSNDFNPIAPASECHVDFSSAIDCSYAQVAGLSPATPQRIEDLMVSMRSDLLRIISRWEQSGQGEGGMDAEEEVEEANDEDASSSSLTPSHQADDDDGDTVRANFGGCLSRRPPRALQSRASFLNGRPSYLLYFWEVADVHQILQSSLQRLNNKAGAADASRAPISSRSSTTSNDSGGGLSRSRRRRQQQEELNAAGGSSFTPLVESIKELAECQRQMVFDRVEDRNHERQLEEQRQQSEGAERSRERAFRRRAELVDLARKYRKLNAELDPNDENTRRLSAFYLEEGRLLEEEIRQLDASSTTSS
ncbi:hypothetical protein MHU86_6257 [Fragilaria crotonensis]|nr:hypothetical protein MHU86_6257 [Fragilaria crotonensis]